MIKKHSDKNVKLSDKDIECVYVMLCRGTEKFNKKISELTSDKEMCEKLIGFDFQCSD